MKKTDGASTVPVWDSLIWKPENASRAAAVQAMAGCPGTSIRAISPTSTTVRAPATAEKFRAIMRWSGLWQ